MKFWIEWQLWQKLCLVLGGLILIVLIYGFCVLSYNKRMLKKLSAADEYQKAEEEQNGDIDDIRRNDIPFGARALESGIQIEGIWISNHNTPAPSPYQPGTPADSRPPSPTLRPISQPSSAAVDTQEEKGPLTSSSASHLNPSYHHRHVSKGSKAETITFTDDEGDPNSFPLERLCSRQKSYSETDKPTKARAFSSVLQRNRHSEPGARNTETLELLEGYDRRPGTGVSGRHNESSSEEFGAAMNRIINERIKSPSRIPIQLEKERRGDLEAMHNHRRSHVAETGQLGSSRNRTFKPTNDEIGKLFIRDI